MRRARQHLAHGGRQPGANRPPAPRGCQGPAGQWQEARSPNVTRGNHQCPWWPCSSRTKDETGQGIRISSRHLCNPGRHGSGPRHGRGGRKRNRGKLARRATWGAKAPRKRWPSALLNSWVPTPGCLCMQGGSANAQLIRHTGGSARGTWVPTPGCLAQRAQWAKPVLHLRGSGPCLLGCSLPAGNHPRLALRCSHPL